MSIEILSQEAACCAPARSGRAAGRFDAGRRMLAVLRVLSAPAVVLGVWARRSRQRATLLEFDEHMLQDIGLRRDDVRREAAKWFWQA